MTGVVAVLQARSSSTRLPAKVLLPLGGLPVVVLAARRAANRGCEVRVAISDDPSDDGLARVLDAHGLSYFRGSLDDTLARVVGAVADVSDQDVVVRLTADNVFPDGMLIERMVETFLVERVRYLYCSGGATGLPHGVGAELMRAGDLRRACAEAEAPYDREHVTPFLCRAFGERPFLGFADLAMGHYRCTLDCFEDYVTLQRVFADVGDAVAEPLLQLVKRLRGMAFQPRADRACDRLVMGTAQLGFPYGVANKSGPPSADDARTMVRTAIVNGVPWIDTARNYQDSEERIGASLGPGWSDRVSIATKLDALSDCPPDASRREIIARVDLSVAQSRLALGGRRLDALMLHRASHRTDWGGVVWQRLQEHQAEGRIDLLGVSVQTVRELEDALDDASVAIVQLPCNLLDWRWHAVESRIRRARAERGLLVHARSALLQGLFLSRDPEAWRRAHVDQPQPVIAWLEHAARSHERSVSALCLGAMSARDWVDGVVVGAETLGQIESNIDAMSLPALTPDQLESLHDGCPRLPEETLDPSKWRKV